MTGAGTPGAAHDERGESESPVETNTPGGRDFGPTPEMGAVSSKLRDLVQRLAGRRFFGSSYHSTILSSISEGVVVYDRELRAQIWNPFLE